MYGFAPAHRCQTSNMMVTRISACKNVPSSRTTWPCSRIHFNGKYIYSARIFLVIVHFEIIYSTRKCAVACPGGGYYLLAIFASNASSASEKALWSRKSSLCINFRFPFSSVLMCQMWIISTMWFPSTFLSSMVCYGYALGRCRSYLRGLEHKRGV
jgi:hypothetical protein